MIHHEDEEAGWRAFMESDEGKRSVANNAYLPEELKGRYGPVNLVPVPMERLLAALGWSGGTVEQVVTEVVRLKRAEEDNWTEGEDETEHEEAEDPSAPWTCPECFCVWLQDVSRCQTCGHQPLGQGVAALLPEHEEAKP